MFSERQYLLRDGDTHIVSPGIMLGLSGFTPAISSLTDDHQYYLMCSQDTFTCKKIIVDSFSGVEVNFLSVSCKFIPITAVGQCYMAATFHL